MSITVTEQAARQIKKQMDQHGNSIGLRLGVKKSGCSGFAYVLDYAEQASDSDRIFENKGIQIIIDHNSLPYLQGIELDYTREGINEAFRFNNPNVKDACGCGESFSV